MMSRMRFARRWALLSCLFCALLVGGSAVFGVWTERGLSDYGENPDRIKTTPYLYSAASQETLSDQEHEVESVGLVPPSTLVDTSDAIVIGRFDGNRSFGYETCAVELTVTDVIKGVDIAEGERVSVYEQMSVGPMKGAESWEIYDPEGYAAFLEYLGCSDSDGAPLVVEPSETPFLDGMVPFLDGCEYVLFLNEQEGHDDATSESVRDACYVLVRSPYARLPVSDGLPVAVLQSRTDFVTVEEAAGLAHIVADERAERRYVDTRRALFEELEIAVRSA